MDGEYTAEDARDSLFRDLLVGKDAALGHALAAAVVYHSSWPLLQTSETNMMLPLLSVSTEGAVSGMLSFVEVELLIGDISWFSLIGKSCTQCGQVGSYDKVHQHRLSHILFSVTDIGDMPEMLASGLVVQYVHHCPVVLVAVLLTYSLTRLHLFDPCSSISQSSRETHNFMLQEDVSGSSIRDDLFLDRKLLEFPHMLLDQLESLSEIFAPAGRRYRGGMGKAESPCRGCGSTSGLCAG